MCPAILSGIAIGDATLVTVPEVIAKVNSAQFPLVFKVAIGALFLPDANAKFSRSYLSGTAQIALCLGVPISSFAHSILCDLPILCSLLN